MTSKSVRTSAAPLAVYAALYGSSPDTFLYESLESRGRRGRYSFLGGRPLVRMTCRGEMTELRRGEGVETIAGDPLDLLRRISRETSHPPLPVPFAGGAVGYFAYDFVRRLERLPDENRDDTNVPDACFLVPGEVVAFDHVEGVAHVCLYRESASDQRMEQILGVLETCESVIDAAPTPLDHDALPRVQANMTRDEFISAVEKAKEHIRAGDIFQVVLSQRFEFAAPQSAIDLYRALRVTNPSPYMYLLNLDGMSVLGSSPESLVRLAGRSVTIHPLAGTRPRGASPEADAALEAELLADTKEAAEHLMLVDLGRNDIGRVCEFGSVRVTRLMGLERCARVTHMVSDVEGRLREGCDAVDLLRATFPAGTVSGAPKIRAMQIIDELETVRRGVYAGAIGYFSSTGNMDVCIAIRSITKLGEGAFVQAGAGIVADSDPRKEFEETLSKAQAVLRAATLARRDTILVIDNYDSFVFNLVQYLGELGATPVVHRNDRINIDQIRALNPAGIVISPGPGRPGDAGITVPLIRELAGTIPILGVCLGHQAIGEAFGGVVSRANKAMHGKTARIEHDGRGVFAGLPTPLTVMRYHSLVVQPENLPDCLEATAWTNDGLIMGLRHKTLSLEGVQFHPESIMTKAGKGMLGNFLRICSPK
jgi:anthranilate synthase component I